MSNLTRILSETSIAAIMAEAAARFAADSADAPILSEIEPAYDPMDLRGLPSPVGDNDRPDGCDEALWRDSDDTMRMHIQHFVHEHDNAFFDTEADADQYELDFNDEAFVGYRPSIIT